MVSFIFCKFERLVMFQPLLDAFVESMHLPTPSKQPLVVLLPKCLGNSIAQFKVLPFYHILNQQYDLVLHDNLNRPCDIAFEMCYGPLRWNLRLQIPQKCIGYSQENERIDMNIYDFGMGFDDMTFLDRYLRMPNYYPYLFKLFWLLLSYRDTPLRIDSSVIARYQETYPTEFLRYFRNLVFHLDNLIDHPDHKDSHSPFYAFLHGSSFPAAYPSLNALLEGQVDFFKREFASFVASNPNAPMRNSAYQALCAYRSVAGGGGYSTL